VNGFEQTSERICAGSMGHASGFRHHRQL
jgi:hypothetical protein